jgi:hypothetical protein
MTTTLSSFVSADQLPNPANLTTRLESVLEYDEQITELQRQIKALEQKREYVIQEHLSAGVMVEGPLSLKAKVTKRESLDVDAFAKKYPDEFRALYQEIGEQKFKPSKQDAAKVLTSFQVEKVCKKTESITYTVAYEMSTGAEL